MHSNALKATAFFIILFVSVIWRVLLLLATSQLTPNQQSHFHFAHGLYKLPFTSYCCNQTETFQSSERPATIWAKQSRISPLLTKCSCMIAVRDAFQLLRACKSSASSAAGLRTDPSTSASMCEEAFMSACRQLWSCVKPDSLMHIGSWCCGGLATAWAWGFLRPGSKTFPSDWVYWAENQYHDCAWHVLY